MSCGQEVVCMVQEGQPKVQRSSIITYSVSLLLCHCPLCGFASLHNHAFYASNQEYINQSVLDQMQAILCRPANWAYVHTVYMQTYMCKVPFHKNIRYVSLSVLRQVVTSFKVTYALIRQFLPS